LINFYFHAAAKELKTKTKRLFTFVLPHLAFTPEQISLFKCDDKFIWKFFTQTPTAHSLLTRLKK